MAMKTWQFHTFRKWAYRAALKYARRVADLQDWRFRGDLTADDLFGHFVVAFIELEDKIQPEFTRTQVLAYYKSAVRCKMIDLLRLHLGKHRIDKVINISTMSLRNDSERKNYREKTSIAHTTFESVELKMILEEAPPEIQQFAHAVLTDRFDKKGIRRDARIEELTNMSARAFERRATAWAAQALQPA